VTLPVAVRILVMSSAVVLRKRGGSEEADTIAELIKESNAYYADLAPASIGWPIRRIPPWSRRWTARLPGISRRRFRNPTRRPGSAGNRDLRERRLYINALLTAEAHQRTGVGTRLVEAAKSWAREQGVMLALCDTFVDSPKSVPLWEKRMGYERRSVHLRKRL